VGFLRGRLCGAWTLGHLIRGGSSWGMDDDVGILRTPFCSFVVLDEDGVGQRDMMLFIGT